MTEEKYPNILPVILAGGAGERLRSVIGEHQKVMAFVGGRPFLSYVLDQICDAGFRKVLLSVGYRSEEIENYFGKSYRDLQLSYIKEENPLGTGGALVFAAAATDRENLLVLNGDSICELDLPSFIEPWEDRDFHVVAAACESGEARYGRILIDEIGHVTGFHEKAAEGLSPWVNAGVYLIKRRLFCDRVPGEPVSLEQELFPIWIRGGKFFAQPVEGSFFDIGVPEGLKIFSNIVEGLGLK